MCHFLGNWIAVFRGKIDGTATAVFQVGVDFNFLLTLPWGDDPIWLAHTFHSSPKKTTNKESHTNTHTEVLLRTCGWHLVEDYFESAAGRLVNMLLFLWALLKTEFPGLKGIRFLFLLGQWLNFKLFGITYLVGKIKFKLFFSGSIGWVSFFRDLILPVVSFFTCVFSSDLGWFTTGGGGQEACKYSKILDFVVLGEFLRILP